jgi:hypothetical protein
LKTGLSLKAAPKSEHLIDPEEARGILDKHRKKMEVEDSGLEGPDSPHAKRRSGCPCTGDGGGR